MIEENREIRSSTSIAAIATSATVARTATTWTAHLQMTSQETERCSSEAYGSLVEENGNHHRFIKSRTEPWKLHGSGTSRVNVTNGRNTESATESTKPNAKSATEAVKLTTNQDSPNSDSIGEEPLERLNCPKEHAEKEAEIQKTMRAMSESPEEEEFMEDMVESGRNTQEEQQQTRSPMELIVDEFLGEEEFFDLTDSPTEMMEGFKDNLTAVLTAISSKELTQEPKQASRKMERPPPSKRSEDQWRMAKKISSKPTPSLQIDDRGNVQAQQAEEGNREEATPPAHQMSVPQSFYYKPVSPPAEGIIPQYFGPTPGEVRRNQQKQNMAYDQQRPPGAYGMGTMSTPSYGEGQQYYSGAPSGMMVQPVYPYAYGYYGNPPPSVNMYQIQSTQPAYGIQSTWMVENQEPYGYQQGAYGSNPRNIYQNQGNHQGNRMGYASQGAYHQSQGGGQGSQGFSGQQWSTNYGQGTSSGNMHYQNL